MRFALKSRDTVRIAGDVLRQNLQRDVSTALRVAGAIDLAQPALADLGGDVIRAETGSWCEGSTKARNRNYTSALAVGGHIVSA